jgi:hypothetical protein
MGLTTPRDRRARVDELAQGDLLLARLIEVHGPDGRPDLVVLEGAAKPQLVRFFNDGSVEVTRAA